MVNVKVSRVVDANLRKAHLLIWYDGFGFKTCSMISASFLFKAIVWRLLHKPYGGCDNNSVNLLLYLYSKSFWGQIMASIILLNSSFNLSIRKFILPRTPIIVQPLSLQPVCISTFGMLSLMQSQLLLFVWLRLRLTPTLLLLATPLYFTLLMVATCIASRQWQHARC